MAIKPLGSIDRNAVEAALKRYLEAPAAQNVLAASEAQANAIANTPQTQQAAIGNQAFVVPNDSITDQQFEQQQVNFLRNIAGMQEGALNNFESRFIDYRPFRESITGQGSQEELRQQQRQQLLRLQGQAEGTAPSIAQTALQGEQNRALAQQLAAAQAQRGGDPGALQRVLARARATQQASNNAAGSQLAMKEQQAAEATFANELAAQRAQDIALQQADLEARRRLATQNAQFANNMVIGDQDVADAARQRKDSQIAGIASAVGSYFSQKDKPKP